MSKTRGCFDPSLANHSEAPTKRGAKTRKRRRRGMTPKIRALVERKKAEANARRKARDVQWLRVMPYVDYLTTKHWQRKRSEAFRHHGRKCNRCGETRRLHVHHRTYENRGCERMKDLEILCEDCHAGEHQHEKPWITDSLTIEFIGLFKQKGEST